MQIVRAVGEDAEQIVDVEEIEIPDLWALAQTLEGPQRHMVLETWYLAHHLHSALQRIAAGADIATPIRTRPFC